MIIFLNNYHVRKADIVFKKGVNRSMKLAGFIALITCRRVFNLI